MPCPRLCILWRGIRRERANPLGRIPSPSWGGEGGGGLPARTLSVCLCVCLPLGVWWCWCWCWWVPARAVSVCLRVFRPASVWLCAQSLEVLWKALRHPWEKCWGSPWDIWGESPHKPGGSFGNCLGNPSPKLRERPWASLGNPEEVLAKFGASPLAIPWQNLGKSWGRPCDILGWLAPMHGPCSGKSLGKP